MKLQLLELNAAKRCSALIGLRLLLDAPYDQLLRSVNGPVAPTLRRNSHQDLWMRFRARRPFATKFGG